MTYDTANGGPWDSALTLNQDVELGLWVLAVGNISCITFDGGGDIIMAKVKVEFAESKDADGATSVKTPFPV